MLIGKDRAIFNSVRIFEEAKTTGNQMVSVFLRVWSVQGEGRFVEIILWATGKSLFRKEFITIQNSMQMK